MDSLESEFFSVIQDIVWVFSMRPETAQKYIFTRFDQIFKTFTS